MAYFSFSRHRLASLWAAGLALFAVSSPFLSAQVNTPTSNDGFNPNVGGTVDVVAVQPNGQILVGGLFTQLQPNGAVSTINRNNVARLNPNGTVDGTFAPQTNGQVSAIVVEPNGQILIGGSFTTVQPAGASAATTRNGLARFNANGTLDTTFNPNFQGTYSSAVYAVALQSNGQILVGGAFNSLQPNGATTATAIPHLARLNSDGSVDTTFNPDPNVEVSAICVQPNGQILIGGGFLTLQPNGATTATSDPYLARLNADGSIDSTFINPGLNGSVLTIALQLDGEIVIGGNFVTYLTAAQNAAGDSATNVDFILRLSSNGTPDPNFLANVSGPVQQVLIQPNGQILVAGEINEVTNGTANFFTVANLARLNQDSSPDMSFVPNPNYTVYGMALQSNGEIVFGGNFTQIQPGNEPAPINRNGLARVNEDGSVDEDFNPNAFGGIGAVAVDSSGNMLIGGSFSSVDGITRSNIARVSSTGVLDTTFAPAVNGPIYAIAVQSNGQIIIGGNFSAVNNVSIQVLARLNKDGSLDTSFVPNPNQGAIYALCVQPNGQILVGGSFYGFGPAIGPPSATTTSITYLGRVNANGSIDTSFQPNPNGNVYSIVYNATNDTVLFSGAFTAVAPIDFSNYQDGSYTEYTYSNPYIALVGAGNGLLYTSFLPNPNGVVYQVAMEPDGKILMCGNFTTLQPNPTSATTVVNGIVQTTTTPLSTRDYIARLNADGSLDQNYSPLANAPIVSLSVNPTNSQVVVGGTFTSISGVTRNFLARLNSDGSVDTGFSASPNGSVDTVEYLSNNQFLVAGSFTTVLPAGASTATTVQHLARFNGDGSLDPTLQSPFQSTVPINCLAVEADDRLDVGGNFISIAGLFATNIARFYGDGTQDDSFYANANGPVYSIVSQTDGSFFVGGAFTAIGHGSANYFAHLNTGSTLDTTYSSFPDGVVYAIAAQTNVPAVIGGSFAHVGGAAVANLARINTNGSLDTSFKPNPNGPVTVVVAEPNGQYLVAGSFTSVAGAARNYFARLNANGSIDTTFNPNPNAAVGALLIQPDGKILVGGSFTTIDGVGRGYIARLNADGSLDTTFNPSANGAVDTMVLQAPGYGAATSSNGSSVDQILVGGSFTNIAGTACNYLARLNFNGTIDTTFNPNPNAAVTALAIQADGKQVVAGGFSTIGGQPRNGIARISNPNPAIQSISVSSDLTTVTFSMVGGPELSNTTFELSTDGLNWSTIGFGTRVGLANTWQLTNLGSLPAGSVFYITVLGQSFSSNGSSTSIFGGVQDFYVVPIADLESSPTASAVVGKPFYYSIAATSTPTSYAASGLPSGLAVNTSTGVISGVATQAGTYTVSLSVSTPSGTTTGSLVISVAASGSSGSPVAPLARLINLSTRAYVTTANPLIAGFGIAGPAAKTVLLRAVGPGLATTFAITDPLSNPHLQLYDSNGQLILSQEGWDGSASIMQIFSEFGAFPLVVGSADSAIVTSLSPGSYTMQVIDGAGTGGVALAEVYDADANEANLSQRLVNISGRGEVNASNLLVGGFAITGSTSKTVLIRAVGPGLTNTFGLPGALSTPILNLYNNQDALLAQNAGWGNPITVNASYPAASPLTIAADASAAGAFPYVAGSADSAIVVTLPPGNYTGQISGAGQSGTALFEIYELPQ